MSNFRRTSGLLVVGVSVALALAACGGGSSGGTPSASTSSSGTTSSSPSTSTSTGTSTAPTSSAPGGATGITGKTVSAAYNAAGSGVVNASDKTGGTVKMTAQSDCDSFDPARTYYAYCWDLQRLFTRSLMGFQSAVGNAGTTVVPDMAAGEPTVSADKKVWTYKLQDGLKFSDGNPITTADIKYGLERIFATDVINGGPSQYYLCLLDKCGTDGAPTYKGPYKDKTGDLTQIATPDATTITFTLNQPYADFNYLMALPSAAPVEKAKDTGSTYGRNVVSSGPFMFKSYSPGKSVVWVRNPNWSQATDHIRFPKADEMDLTIISDTTDAENRLLAGDTDLFVDGGITPPSIAKVQADPSKKADSDDPITGFTRYLTIQQKVKPLDNVHCRNAVEYALDKNAWLKARGGSFGGIVANTMTPPLIPGYVKSFVPFPDNNGDGDVTKAKSELALCGQPNGFSTKLAYTTTGTGPQVAAAVQSSLAKAGIKLTLAANDGSTYYSTFLGSPATVLSKGLGLGLAGWGADFPTAFGFWQSIANGANILPEGNTNYPSLNDPAVNKALNDLTTTTDPAAATTLAQTVDHTVMTDAVYAPSVYDKTYYYHSARLTNVYLNAGVGNYYDYVQLGVNS
jgi:peptide/nickel transport system substrate-binding protein